MSRVLTMRGFVASAVMALLLPLTGCPFFVCEGKADCGTSSTSTGTGDYVFVSNSTSGQAYISIYEIGSGTLTAVTGSPFQVNDIPLVMKVTPNDDFLLVGTSSGLYEYAISSAGVLSSAQLLLNEGVDGLDISADGNFLFVLTLSTLGQEQVNEYPLAESTGALGTGVTSFPLTATSCGYNTATTPATQSCTVQVDPSLKYVAVAMGSAGTAIFPYTSAGGYTAQTATIGPTSGSADDSAAFDGSDHLYIARTTVGVIPYTSLGNTSPTALSGISFTSGVIPRAVVLSSSYNYLYTADTTTANTGTYISVFSVSTGALTQLGSLQQVGPTDVSVLGVDRSGTYLLAAGYNTTNGLQMFTTSSSGIAAVAYEPTSDTTTVPVAMAFSH